MDSCAKAAHERRALCPRGGVQDGYRGRLRNDRVRACLRRRRVHSHRQRHLRTALASHQRLWDRVDATPSWPGVQSARSRLPGQECHAYRWNFHTPRYSV